MKLRGKLIHEDKRMTFPPFEMMAAATVAEGNIWAGYRKNRTQWLPEEMRAKHGPGTKAKAVYFGGCTVSYVENDIGQAAVTLLDAAGVDFTTLGNVENCCGTPMLVAGKWELFLETLKKNVAAVKAAGADTVVSSCPACDMMWRHVYPEWAASTDLLRHHGPPLQRARGREAQGRRSLPGPTGRSPARLCHIGRVPALDAPPRVP
jgi:Fe-S oxidoreductase